MIAIDVSLAPIQGSLEPVPVPILIPGPGDPPIVALGIDVMQENSQNIYNFFKNCIDQQFILNTVCFDVSSDKTNYITRYFATTTENAQAFLNLFLDMSAEFSMKKMWSLHSVDLIINQYPIDFDSVVDNFDLIGEYCEIFKVKY